MDAVESGFHVRGVEPDVSHGFLRGWLAFPAFVALRDRKCSYSATASPTSERPATKKIP